MTVKKKGVVLLFCVIALCGLFVKGVSDRMNHSVNEKVEGVLRADVAKMVSLLFYTKSELKHLPREITDKDTKEEQWYDIYMNGMDSLGLLQKDRDEETGLCRPLELISYEETKELLEHLSLLKAERGDKESKGDEEPEDDKKEFQTEIEFFANQKKAKEKITKTDWIQLYNRLVESFADEKKELFSLKKMLLLEVGSEKKKAEDKGSQNTELGKGMCMTEQGIFYYDNYDMASLKDKKIEVFTKENEILYFSDVIEEETILSNVWIEKNDTMELCIFINGIEKNFQSEKPLSDKKEEVIADLTILNGKVVHLTTKPNILKGKVLTANREYIELDLGESQEKFYLKEDFKLYRLYGEIGMETEAKILVGYDNIEFVLEDNKICAGLIKNSIYAKNIRVLLKTDGFQDTFHDKIKVTSDTPYVLQCEDGETSLKAGEEVVIEQDDKRLKEGRITFKSKETDGKIKILSLKRNQESPSYRGSIELSRQAISSETKGDTEEGKILMINELSLEEYLYAVIPSEMPSSYGVEALKVQAVCARSYAYTHLLSNGYRQYGAHVDDSVTYQVYNNNPETKETIQAVKETYGQVLEYQNAIITAYYFSTSAGHTSSAEEVWLFGKEIPYLKGYFQTVEGEIVPDLDLRKEEEFRKFLLERKDKTYDSEFPWYRWEVKESAEHIRDSIEKNIKSRYKANPDLIQTLQEDGSYQSVPVRTIGTVKNITVVKRATGGLAKEVVVKGSEKTIKIFSEYNIRILLAPLADQIVRQDGSIVENQSMLPSGFFVVEKETEEEKITFTFSGGGYGHGVGMSQNGVKAMADLGIDYEKILKHYYRETTLGYIYN